jgi:hypothetical protein
VSARVQRTCSPAVLADSACRKAAASELVPLAGSSGAPSPVPPCSSACALVQHGRSSWRSAITLTPPSHSSTSKATPSALEEVPSSSSEPAAVCTSICVAAGPWHASTASASARAVVRP